MRKLITVVIVLVVLAFVGYKIYEFYIPKAIAKALTTGEDMAMVPPKIQKKVENLKVKVDKNIESLPQLMKESKIGYEDLFIMIDRADPDQFFAAYEELKEFNWQTTNDVFDIGMRHVAIEGYDLEKFRDSFNGYATVKKIENGIKRIENNELLTSISIPVAKETAKKILENKKDAILKKLEEIESQD